MEQAACKLQINIEPGSDFRYQGSIPNVIMEALLSLTLLMIAVDGPVTPSEISQDINARIMTETSASKSSAWTGGPTVNMWTGGLIRD